MKKFVVTGNVVNAAVERAATRMSVILQATWGQGDERYSAADERFHQAIWGVSVQVFDFTGRPKPVVEPFELEDYRLQQFIQAGEGRLLTWIEAVFPAAHQCEAIKSLARTILWDIRRDIEKNAVGASDSEEKV